MLFRSQLFRTTSSWWLWVRIKIRYQFIRRSITFVSPCLTLIVLLVAIRGRDLLATTSFNPDESELVLQGIRASSGGLRLLSNSALGTIGPVWPAFLGICSRIGIPLTLRTAHLLTGFAYIWIFYALWSVYASRTGWLRSAKIGRAHV